MALLVPDAGEAVLLAAALGKTPLPSTTVSLRLYTAPSTTPGETWVAGTVTEATGGGYAAKTLNHSGWTVSGTTTATQSQQTWTFTGSVGNVYGYYVTDSNGVMLWVEKFTDGPYNIQNNNDQIKVTPTISLD